MSTTPRLDPTLAAWLEAGPRELPEVTRQAILGAARATPQRRPGPTLRLHQGRVTRFQVLGLAAAFVVISGLGVLVAGWRDPVELPPTVPSPTAPTETPTSQDVTRFTSPLYGYSLSYPAEWTVTPATEPLAGAVSWQTLGASADVFSSGPIPTVSWVRPWFAARAIPVPEGTIAADWARTHIPNRAEQQPASDRSSVICVFGRGGPPSAITYWQATTIGGAPAVLRAACGFVDAVAVVDDRAYVFSMFSNAPVGSRRDRFEAIAATIRFQASEPTSTFTSDRYGVTLDRPAGWTVSPAREPWTGEPIANGPWADVLSAPRRLVAAHWRYWVSIRAVDVPVGTTAAGWADANVPLRPEFWELDDGRRHCRLGRTTTGISWTERWSDDTISGQPARVRSACGFVDAVVVLDQRAYLLSAYRHPASDQLPDPLAVLETIRFQPGTAFTSDRYGYTIQLPGGWTARAATKAWVVPGRLPSHQSVLADEFTSPSVPHRTVRIVSAEIPAGQADDPWIRQYLTRRLVSNGRCAGRINPMGGPHPEPWSAWPIAGHPGRVRSACGYVDGVVVVGSRAYVLTADGPFVYQGATPETRADFDLLAARIELHPETARDDP